MDAANVSGNALWLVRVVAGRLIGENKGVLTCFSIYKKSLSETSNASPTQNCTFPRVCTPFEDQFSRKMCIYLLLYCTACIVYVWCHPLYSERQSTPDPSSVFVGASAGVTEGRSTTQVFFPSFACLCPPPSFCGACIQSVISVSHEYKGAASV